jgi:hypothetical protein
MSEYQYYEFQAIDRPLTAEQMARLRSLSSRATITPTRFANFYTWGDFKGDPADLMEHYFDLFVYVTNWGTHELMLRLPRRLLTPADVAAYCASESLQAWSTTEQLILDFRSEDESGAEFDEDDGDGWMSALLPLRAELGSGDRRALYLGWLACAQALEFDDDHALEPAVPRGLADLSTAQQTLASFLRLDPDLIEVAAEASPPLRPALSRQLIHTWVRGLSDSERIDVLVRLVAEDAPHHLHAELIQRVLQATGSGAEQSLGPRGGRRSVEQLLAAAAVRRQARERAAAERAERERQRQDRERAAARAAYLDTLVGRVDDEWRRVEEWLTTKRQTDYDRAVGVLVDLRDVAARNGQIDNFMQRLEQLRTRHAKKVTLLERLQSARLLPEPASASNTDASGREVLL